MCGGGSSMVVRGDDQGKMKNEKEKEKGKRTEAKARVYQHQPIALLLCLSSLLCDACGFFFMYVNMQTIHERSLAAALCARVCARADRTPHRVCVGPAIELAHHIKFRLFWSSRPLCSSFPLSHTSVGHHSPSPKSHLLCMYPHSHGQTPSPSPPPPSQTHLPADPTYYSSQAKPARPRRRRPG
jgi:hypothetical protein